MWRKGRKTPKVIPKKAPPPQPDLAQVSGGLLLMYRAYCDYIKEEGICTLGEMPPTGISATEPGIETSIHTGSTAALYGCLAC